MAKIKLIPAISKAAAKAAEFALETIWSRRGAKNGIATLDSSKKLSVEQLPDTLPTYEEGTWTPVVKPYMNSDVSNISQPSYLANENTYIRIGNIVKITFALTFSGSPPSFVIDPNSLPFAVGSKMSDHVTNARADGMDCYDTIAYDGIRCLNHVKFANTIRYINVYGDGLNHFANEPVLFSAEYRIEE